LSDGPICFAEVWGEENVEDAAGQAFDRVGDWEDGNALGLVDLLVIRRQEMSLDRGNLRI
jgi:hypothetical protein